MIYKFSVINDYNKSKIFYLSADNLNQLYRRIANSYNISKDHVTLIAEYEPIDFDHFRLVKEHIKEDKKSKNVLAKSSEVWSKLTKKGEPWKSAFVSKYGFTVVDISGSQDVPELVEKYSKVKVYWECGEKRGTKKYYACVK